MKIVVLVLIAFQSLYAETIPEATIVQDATAAIPATESSSSIHDNNGNIPMTAESAADALKFIRMERKITLKGDEIMFDYASSFSMPPTTAPTSAPTFPCLAPEVRCPANAPNQCCGTSVCRRNPPKVGGRSGYRCRPCLSASATCTATRDCCNAPNNVCRRTAPGGPRTCLSCIPIGTKCLVNGDCCTNKCRTIELKGLKGKKGQKKCVS